jgi:hypothetical protein
MTTKQAGRIGGLRRAERIRTGELPRPTTGGRPPQPRYCERCGMLCESATEARRHACLADTKGKP